MGRIIIKIKDRYLEWSSIVDAPVTFGMNKEELEKYHLEEYGVNGHRDFKNRMERVELTGTSNKTRLSIADVIKGNQAGPNESELTIEEIYQAYCLRKPIRNGWHVPTN